MSSRRRRRYRLAGSVGLPAVHNLLAGRVTRSLEDALQMAVVRRFASKRATQSGSKKVRSHYRDLVARIDDGSRGISRLEMETVFRDALRYGDPTVLYTQRDLNRLIENAPTTRLRNALEELRRRRLDEFSTEELQPVSEVTAPPFQDYDDYGGGLGDDYEPDEEPEEGSAAPELGASTVLADINSGNLYMGTFNQIQAHFQRALQEDWNGWGALISPNAHFMPSYVAFSGVAYENPTDREAANQNLRLADLQTASVMQTFNSDATHVHQTFNGFEVMASTMYVTEFFMDQVLPTSDTFTNVANRAVNLTMEYMEDKPPFVMDDVIVNVEADYTARYHGGNEDLQDISATRNAPAIVGNGLLSLRQAIQQAIYSILHTIFTSSSSESFQIRNIHIMIEMAGLTTGGAIPTEGKKLEEFRKFFDYVLMPKAKGSAFVPMNVTSDLCFYHCTLQDLNSLSMAQQKHFRSKHIKLLSKVCDLPSENFLVKGYSIKYEPMTMMKTVADVSAELDAYCLEHYNLFEGHSVSTIHPSFGVCLYLALMTQKPIYTFDACNMRLIPNYTVLPHELQACYDYLEQNNNYTELMADGSSSGEEEQLFLQDLVDYVVTTYRNDGTTFDTRQSQGILSWKHEDQRTNRHTVGINASGVRVPYYSHNAYVLPTERIVLGFHPKFRHFFRFQKGTSLAHMCIANRLTVLNQALFTNDQAYFYEAEEARIRKHWGDIVSCRTRELRTQYDDYTKMSTFCFVCGRFYFRAHRCVAVHCKKCRKEYRNPLELKQHLEEAQTCELKECTKCYADNVPAICLEEHVKTCDGRLKKCRMCKRFIRVKGVGSVSMKEHLNSLCKLVSLNKCKKCNVRHAPFANCRIGRIPKVKKKALRATDIIYYDIETRFQQTQGVGCDTRYAHDSLLPLEEWEEAKEQRFGHYFYMLCCWKAPTGGYKLFFDFPPPRCEPRLLPHHKCLENLIKWCDTNHIEYNEEELAQMTEAQMHEFYTVKAMRANEGEKWMFATPEEFVTWIQMLDRSTVFIAHNGAKYDARFMYQMFIQHNMFPHRVLSDGPSITQLEILLTKEERDPDNARKGRRINVVFKDSLKMGLKSSLKNIGKIVGCSLDLGVAKGDFPHLFNCERGYVGPLPERKYWTVSDERWAELEAEFANKPFDFDQCMEDYCFDDCLTLGVAMQQHWFISMSRAGIDPLLQTATAASLAFKVFRANYLRKEGIVTLTYDQSEFARKGYAGGNTTVLQHAWFAYDPETYPLETFVEGDEELYEELKDVDFSHLIGTEAMYADIVSMYPNNMVRNNHVGLHEPVTYEGYSVPDNYLDLEGVIHCKITSPPPEELPYPLLPTKDKMEDGSYRTVFRTLASEGEEYWGTLVEVRDAVRNYGYTILEVYRVDDYGLPITGEDLFGDFILSCIKKKTEASKCFQDRDLATAYSKAFGENHYGTTLDVDALMAPKNPGDKAFYKLAANSSYGKLAQGAKVSEAFMTIQDFQDEMVKQLANYNTTLSLRGWRLVHNGLGPEDSVLHVKMLQEDDERLRRSTMVTIAAYITAYSRMQLTRSLKMFDSMGFTPMYNDTDSIVFYGKNEVLKKKGNDLYEGLNAIIPEGCPERFGTFLGQWENEEPDRRIVECIFKGPKDYSMLFDNGEVVVKIKGIQARMANSFIKGTFLVNKQTMEKRVEIDSLRKWHFCNKLMVIFPDKYMLCQRYDMIFRAGKDHAVETHRGDKTTNVLFNIKRNLMTPTTGALFHQTTSLPYTGQTLYQAPRPGFPVSRVTVEQEGQLLEPFRVVAEEIAMVDTSLEPNPYTQEDYPENESED